MNNEVWAAHTICMYIVIWSPTGSRASGVSGMDGPTGSRVGGVSGMDGPTVPQEVGQVVYQLWMTP